MIYILDKTAIQMDIKIGFISLLRIILKLRDRLNSIFVILLKRGYYIKKYLILKLFTQGLRPFVYSKTKGKWTQDG